MAPVVSAAGGDGGAVEASSVGDNSSVDTSSTVDTSTGDNGGAVEATEALPADDSFAFPSDFESITDEPIDEPLQADPAPAQVQPKKGAPAAPAAAKTPAAAAKPAAQTATPAPAPAKTPAQTAAQTPPAGTTQPPTARPGPRQLAERLQQNRDSLVAELASTRFAVTLTKEETDALEVDAVKALPAILSRLGANLYLDMASTSLNQIANLVPQMVEMVSTKAVQDNAAESEFFTQFPNIDRAKHGDVVQQYANLFRAQNPKATREQAIKFVGTAVSAALGLPMTVAAQKPQGNGAARAAAPRPFAPAGGGRVVSQTPIGGEKTNPFDGIGMDFDE